jgi:hypothetical protein
MTQTNPYETDPWKKKPKRHVEKGLIPELLDGTQRRIKKSCKKLHEAFWGKK